MQRQLKKGQIVRVYEDPITRTKVEGEAKLIRPVGFRLSSEPCERWQVVFLEEPGQIYERQIAREG